MPAVVGLTTGRAGSGWTASGAGIGYVHQLAGHNPDGVPIPGPEKDERPAQ